MTTLLRTAALAAAAVLPAPGAAADGGAVTASGESRVRYETLGGQFRAGREGGDQLLALRTLLRAEADLGAVRVGAELQDSRAYLDDSGTPLSTSFVNALEPLQLYAVWESPLGARGELTLGRMTLDIGSRRFVERNSFRNTINAYSGAYWRADWADGSELHAFATVPVGKQPDDRDALADNEAAVDREQWGRLFWGAHYRKADAFAGAWAEVFVYGLNEDDRDGLPTLDRAYVEPGARFYRPPAPGRWDFELEGAYRFGERSASTAADEPVTQDVDAQMLHAEIGYTFDHDWRLRLSLDYDFASGDETPGDGAFEQYERLFGTRRGDLGNTSIHGPLTRQNISAPGARVGFARGRWDGRLAYKAAYLASATDAWAVARTRDPAGRSGRFIGHALDGRARAWVIPDALRAELGASTLLQGDFAEAAPGAADNGDTLYGYVQLTAFY